MPQGGLYTSNVLGLDVAVQTDRLRFYKGSAMLLESDELVGRLEQMVEVASQRADEEARLCEAAEQENARLRAELDRLNKK